jgi:broad specificity phosphatase PhoE
MLTVFVMTASLGLGGGSRHRPHRGICLRAAASLAYRAGATMPTILLIRHGQASFGAADYDDLSPAGRAQAEAVARELARDSGPVQRIVSGSLRRQLQTAEPTASRRDLPIAVDPRLNEYEMDSILAAHGDTTVRTGTGPGGEQVGTREFQQLLERGMLGWLGAGDQTPADESWPAFERRARAALDELAAGLSRGATALAFTSGGVIAAICVALLELPALSLLRFNRVSVNGAITTLASGRSGLSLVSFNEHRYLHLDPAATVTVR